MTPLELARSLQEELELALADLHGEGSQPSIRAVHPPDQLEAGTSFRVCARTSTAQSVEVELPTNLAIGYLADEEAAVNEWRDWVRALWHRRTA